MKNRSIVINGEEYEIPTRLAIELSAYLTRVWWNLGKPDDVFSDAGKKLMTVIIASWQDLFPQDSKDWIAQREDYRKNEMSIHDQVKKHTGRSMASVPEYIFVIMKKFYKKNKLNRKFWMKLVKEFPIFQVCNKI